MKLSLIDAILNPVRTIASLIGRRSNPPMDGPTIVIPPWGGPTPTFQRMKFQGAYKNGAKVEHLPLKHDGQLIEIRFMYLPWMNEKGEYSVDSLMKDRDVFLRIDKAISEPAKEKTCLTSQ